MDKFEIIKKAKRKQILIFIIVVAFIFVNILWFFTIYTPYRGYNYAIKHAERKCDISYRIDKPFYLYFDSQFLSIGYTSDKDREKNNNVEAVFIYADIRGNYKYLVNVVVESGPNYTYVSVIEVDRNGNFIPEEKSTVEENEKLKRIYDNNYDYIISLINHANDILGLEPEHDFKMGITALIDEKPMLFAFGIIYNVTFLILIFAGFIWKIKYKIPFQIYNLNMEPTLGNDFYSYKKMIREKIIDYALYTSDPQFLRNNGFLLIRRNQFENEKISLMIQPRKDEIKYFILRCEINESPRKSPKTEFSYLNGMVISTDPFIYEHREEIQDLIIHAQNFWEL